MAGLMDGFREYLGKAQRSEAPSPEDAPIGTGIARQGADTVALRKQWQRAYIDAVSRGESFPQYEEWVALQQGR